MGAFRLLRHGTSLRGSQHGGGVNVQRFGRERQHNNLLDLAHHAAVDLQILVESVLGAISHQEILRRNHPVGYGCGLCPRGVGTTIAPLFHRVYSLDGHYRV